MRRAPLRGLLPDGGETFLQRYEVARPPGTHRCPQRRDFRIGALDVLLQKIGTALKDGTEAGTSPLRYQRPGICVLGVRQ